MTKKNGALAAVKPKFRPKFDGTGLIPVVVQDADSDVVLSLVYANSEALEKTRTTEFLWRYSRKQRRLIQKGETSGNTQRVVELSLDCDRDAVLARVLPDGPACHTGKFSCFGKEKSADAIIPELVRVISERRRRPKTGSYTSGLVRDRKAIAAKLREECQELVEAEKPGEVAWETADLLYFMLVYLENRNVPWKNVLTELERRRKKK